MKIWNFARYQKKVEIDGTRSLPECEAALARITRPPFTFGADARLRPFVGSIRGDCGRMWFSRKVMMVSPARTLNFCLQACGSGCKLVGDLTVTLPLRLFTGFYLIFCIIGSLAMVIGSVIYAQKVNWPYELRILVQGVGFGFLFMYGYHGLCVLVGRRAEQQALKIIKHVMASETAESVVVDLLG
jgi:hypothetical protein